MARRDMSRAAMARGDPVTEEVHVELDDYTRPIGPALIVLSDDPLYPVYHRQAGCIGCEHPSARGLLRPLLGFALADSCSFGTSGVDHTSPGNVAFRAHHVILLNEALIRRGVEFRVDPARVDDSMEAWVFLRAPDGRAAILTWENCD